MVQMLVRLPKSESGTDISPSEWAIIELQGDLESRSSGALDGSFVGDLHYSNKGVPILIIGHHIMFGKIVKMEKPIAVLQRERTSLPYQELSFDSNEFSHNEQKTDSCFSTEYLVTAVVNKKILFKTRPKPIVSNVPKKI